MGALFGLRRRIGRTAFWLWLAVILTGLAVAGFQALSGVGSATFAVMILLWCWFALHVNRRHDAGKAGGLGLLALLSVPPLLFPGVFALAGALMIASGRAQASLNATVDGDNPAFGVTLEMIRVFAEVAGIGFAPAAAASALFAAASLPFALALVCSLAVGLRAGDPDANYWGAAPGAGAA